MAKRKFDLRLFERARCRICNCVASSEIVSDTGDINPNSFVLEEDGLGFRCYSCNESIRDTQVEFDEEELKGVYIG